MFVYLWETFFRNTNALYLNHLQSSSQSKCKTQEGNCHPSWVCDDSGISSSIEWGFLSFSKCLQYLIDCYRNSLQWDHEVAEEKNNVQSWHSGWHKVSSQKTFRKQLINFYSNNEKFLFE